MAWTARLLSVTRQGRMVFPVVEFDNGAGEVFTQNDFQGDNVTVASLAKMVKARIASLEARDAAFTALTAVVGQAITVPSPTQAEIDAEAAKDAYFAKLKDRKTLRQALAAGDIAANNATLAAAESFCTTNFRMAYLADPRYRIEA